jgi:hypothetical protein
MKKLALVILSLTFFSCSSDDDAATPITPTPVTNSVAYFYSKIDNASVTFDQNETANPTSVYVPSTSTHSNGGNYYFDYTSGMERNSSDLTNLDITFNNLYNSATFAEETTNFYTNFNTKPTNFLTATQATSLVKGISLTYTDSNGDMYSTLDGNQTGSTISYSSTTNGTGISGDKTVTIVGTVNCKLYNQANITQFKTLTNGSFKLIFHEATQF